MNAIISKQAVATSFNRAANTYDAHADLQRYAVESLVERIDPALPVKRILDIGSGTGYCSQRLGERFPDAELVNLDIAMGMLQHARRQPLLENNAYICADAERLPFQEGSFDLVFSSLAIQWCGDYPDLFADIRRVARPGAQCLLSTLTRDTLQELRSAWARVDDYTHVNHFAEVGQLLACLTNSERASLSVAQETRLRRYASVTELSRELKSIGAHNMNTEQARGLTGKNKFQRLQNSFLDGSKPGRGQGVTWDLLYLDYRGGE